MNFEELKKTADSYKSARIIQVACDLKLFDVVASERRSASGIAEALKLETRAAELFCNALAGMGLLEKRNNKFSNTEVSQKFLVTSSPLYYGWIIRHASHGWESWGRLNESLKTGRALERKEDAKGVEAEQEAFIMGMHSIIVARGDAEYLSDRLNLKNVHRMLDLAGGSATFPIVFCQNHLDLRATVFDLPETVIIAKQNLSRYPEVAKRIDFVVGDFYRDELPSGFDLVFISNIIHMNNEEQNVEMFRKAYAALNSGGRIVIKDHLLNEDLTFPKDGAVFSMQMLLHTNGRDYGYHEVEKWLVDLGFSKTERLKLKDNSPFEIIQAVK